MFWGAKQDCKILDSSHDFAPSMDWQVLPFDEYCLALTVDLGSAYHTRISVKLQTTSLNIRQRRLALLFLNDLQGINRSRNDLLFRHAHLRIALYCHKIENIGVN